MYIQKTWNAAEFRESIGLTYKDEMNFHFMGLLMAGVIPWYAPWYKPLPLDYQTKEPFRGINFLSLRADYDRFCPYWVPLEHLREYKLKPRPGTRGTPVIVKTGAIPRVTRFYNLDQVQGIEVPQIERPVKPDVETAGTQILEYFKDMKKFDKFNYLVEDYPHQDHYYYLLFQFFCYNRLCSENKLDIPFRPELVNQHTLSFKIGASFLAAYCRVSTPFYGVSFYERNCWKTLLQEEKNALFEATAAALSIYDAVMESAALSKAS